jgi:hypothetical protein
MLGQSEREDYGKDGCRRLPVLGDSFEEKIEGDYCVPRGSFGWIPRVFDMDGLTCINQVYVLPQCSMVGNSDLKFQ